jgi:tRNA(fMet)-specific endonuclease VapC
MKRFLLDTNAAADCIFRRRGVDTRVRQARLKGAKIGIGVPVLAELLAGIENSASRDKNLEVLNRHLQLFRIWPFTTDAARVYGKLFAELRRAGRMVPSMDLMIASIALVLGNCTVITCDSDLSAVPDLNVDDWTT